MIDHELVVALARSHTKHKAGIDPEEKEVIEGLCNALELLAEEHKARDGVMDRAASTIADLEARFTELDGQLLEIHRATSCVAEVPPVRDEDCLTVRRVKGMAALINQYVVGPIPAELADKG